MNLSFGFIPDLLRGKKPDEALKDSVVQGAITAGAIFGLPALAGAAGTGAAAGEAAGATTGAFNFSPSLGGLLEGGKEAMGYVKPIGEAAGAAQAVGGLLSGPQIQAPQPQGINPQGSQTLAQIAQQGQVSPEELMKRRYQTNWG